MNKICTSIVQSKKLIELGIDINTADFMWEYNPDKETYCNKPNKSYLANGIASVQRSMIDRFSEDVLFD